MAESVIRVDPPAAHPSAMNAFERESPDEPSERAAERPAALPCPDDALAEEAASAPELPAGDEAFAGGPSGEPAAPEPPDNDDVAAPCAAMALPQSGAGIGEFANAEFSPECAGDGPVTASPHPDHESDAPDPCGSKAGGLLCYKKWWYRRDVELSVNGEMLNGTPIFIRENTLRVVNDSYSYFIPMGNIDYIRTPDGLKMSRLEFE